MAMLAQFAIQCFQEHFISDFAHIHAGVIKDGNNAFVLLFHKVHNDLIVEVVDLEDTSGNKPRRKKKKKKTSQVKHQSHHRDQKARWSDFDTNHVNNINEMHY